VRIAFLAAVVFLCLLAIPRIIPAEATASDLSYTNTCSGGKADVTFRWTGNAPGGQQWFDLTLFDNGWQPGTFIGAGPIDGSVTSYTWSGLVASQQHVVRINQLVNGQWQTSQSWLFTPCAVPAAPTPPAQMSSPAPASNCHPSYQGGTDTATGGCIRKGIGDYDCSGGSGNGPNYVRGPVRVVGPDEFALDADHDGVACER
jgi:hypothetical protein